MVANNPMFKGGVLFVDSADKATRFIQLCDAFNVPLLFLADVPGFMVGTAVERQGIIRHGAKMISAVSEATVPKICVIVRKAYGAGLYAMAGPGFEPDATLALPTAKIAVMGAEAAVNAVYYNRLAGTRLDPAQRERRDQPAAGRVRGRHRRAPAGRRAGGRRRGRAGGPARPADPPVRGRARQGPVVLPAPAWRHPSEAEVCPGAGPVRATPAGRAGGAKPALLAAGQGQAAVLAMTSPAAACSKQEMLGSRHTICA